MSDVHWVSSECGNMWFGVSKRKKYFIRNNFNGGIYDLWSARKGYLDVFDTLDEAKEAAKKHANIGRTC